MKILLYSTVNPEIPVCLAALTQREWELLLLLAEGKSNAEIAEKLYVTVKSVHNSKNRIANKLSLKGYLTLADFAVRQRKTLVYWFGILKNKSANERLKIIISMFGGSFKNS